MGGGQSNAKDGRRASAARSARAGVVAGIDEAGLGPLLGPLTIGFSAFRTRASQGDLWRILRKLVSDDPKRDADHLIVADSKRVFTRNPRGARRLEASALSFLAQMPGAASPPRNGRELLELAPAGLRTPPALLARHPWYAYLPDSLPVHAKRDYIENRVDRLREELARQEPGLLEAGVRVVPAGELNASFGETDNKGLSLWNLTAGLVRWLWEQHAHLGLDLVIDRHGGRIHYGGLLAKALQGASVKVREEGPEQSVYAVNQASRNRDGASRRMRVVIVERAEQRSFAVALASCLAKYARETCMQAFNAYFADLQPGLRPTAGYTQDGRRWLSEAEQALGRAALEQDVLVRSR